MRDNRRACAERWSSHWAQVCVAFVFLSASSPQAIPIEPGAEEVYRELANLRFGIAEQQYTEVTTLLTAGRTIEVARTRLWISKSKGRARTQSQLSLPGGGKTTLDTFVDMRGGKVYYKVGEVASQAPDGEARPILENLGTERTITLDGKEVYELHTETHDGIPARVFVIRDEKKGTPRWERLWIAPGTGFLHRRERYEPKGLTVMERSEVKIHEVVPDHFLLPNFSTDSIRVLSIADLATEYRRNLAPEAPKLKSGATPVP